MPKPTSPPSVGSGFRPAPDPLTASASENGLDTVIGQLADRRMVRDAARFVREHISKQPPVQRLFSFMPTMLTRVSPFHFKTRTKTSEWPLVRLDSGEGSSWGKMVVVGELLIIFDETVLFSLLSLMTQYQTDAFETSLEEVCRLAEIKPTPSVSQNICNSLRRLAGTRIDLQLSQGSGKKKKLIKEMTGSILSYADMDRQAGAIRVVVNPYFLELYAQSFVTNIDLKFRAGLKSDISKALYRYFQGRYEPRHSIELVKLARSINLDLSQNSNRLRSKIRNALRELEAKNYLQEYSLTRDNRVEIAKSPHATLEIKNQILDVQLLTGNGGVV